MILILSIALFGLGLVTSIRILKVARKGINQRVLYCVSGCVNYKYALAIGIMGFSLCGAYLWLSFLGMLAHIIARAQG